MDKYGITQAILTSTLLSLVSAGAFGSFGAMVQYLYLVVKGENEYNFSSLIQYAVMGFFVGMVASEVMHMVFDQVYPGIVLISGFIFMKILDFFNSNRLETLAGLIIKK